MDPTGTALEAGIKLATLYPILAFGVVVGIAIIVSNYMATKAAERQANAVGKRYDAMMAARDSELDALRTAVTALEKANARQRRKR